MRFICVLMEEKYIEIPENMLEKETWIKEDKGIASITFCDVNRNFERPKEFYIGKDGEIKIPGTKLIIKIDENELFIEGNLETEPTYWNQRRIGEHQITIQRGDSLFIKGIKIEFFSDYICIYGEENLYKVQLYPLEKGLLPFKGFPDYKRSPRIIKRIPNEKIEIKSPPIKTNGKKGGLLMVILPTFATMAVTIGIGMLLGRGKYLLMSVAATGVTTVISILRYYSDQKEMKEINRKRDEQYQKYLLQKRKQIFRTYEAEKEYYQYNYPSVTQINDIVHNFRSRIYERMATDKDFLTFSIGKQWCPVSFTVSLQEAEGTASEDMLYQQAAQLKDEYEMIWKEKVIDLKGAHLGLVGDKEIIHQQLKNYLIQLCTAQSYHDLQIIAIFDEKYLGDFSWMKWLPHCKIHALNVRGLIHTEKARDQILNSMNQILKERYQKLEESKKEARFQPHFLFIIDEPKFIMDHSIMEYLDKEGDKLGFSIIYTSYLQANLPENIGTVLLLNHAKEGTLLLEEKIYKNEKIILPNTEHINNELFARDLSVLNHVLGTTSHIPESITFFEMYKAQNPQELDIINRWKTHHAEKSLAVPLGVRAVDDIVELNLHEKAHGPHGLVAGTTGSGKSEIIQSYILSLAVNFHPYEVGFLLIDYKGGGMAGLFKNLPHLLGTITNLDGSESMRALASIKSELARRQQMFSDNSVNHINAYMSLFREGKVAEPIPHLFLISDEFAELKKEQPEFMKELVSTARIGRSLGVHLILATQKPTGVVDDQIWTNSKFKLALKVQNEADSKEILKTPDAASITQAGRAYLQVGNNEIYELFQSAWSGATYIKEQEKEVTLDNRVYLINDLGQRVLVNKDLNGTKAENTAKATQLDATIDYISQLYGQEDTIPVKKPWLPSLTPLVVCEQTQVGVNANEISVPIGIIDIPEEQKQESYRLNFTENGNLMYIASSGFGKSFLLTTIAIGLAMHYPVSTINLYILDFGNNALIALKRLPHTAEYITLDDTEKYQKFKKLVTQEMQNRKKCLASVYAQNFQVYNQTSKEKLKAIVILIDNFDAVKEMGFEEEEYFTRVSRDGVSLGIYFVIAASRTNAIRGATFNNFKTKIAGFNFEKNEIMNLVGRSTYTLPEIKGRCMLKYGERVSCMQIYAMVNFINDVEYREKTGNLLDVIRQNCHGEEAEHMPIMPEEVTMQTIQQFRNPAIDLFLGLETEKVILEGIRYSDSPFMVLGSQGSGKTNLLKVLIQQMIGKMEIQIFDSSSRELKEYENKSGVQYIRNMEQFVTFMDELEAEVIAREKEPEQSCMNKKAIFIDDLSSFFSRKTTSESEIGEMFARAADMGILFIASNPLDKFYGTDAITEFFKRSANGMLVSPQGYTNVAPTKLEPRANEGAFYGKNKSMLLRIPKA